MKQRLEQARLDRLEAQLLAATDDHERSELKHEIAFSKAILRLYAKMNPTGS